MWTDNEVVYMKKGIIITILALQLFSTPAHALEYRYVLRRKQAIAGVEKDHAPVCFAPKRVESSEPLKNLSYRTDILTSRFSALKNGAVKEVLKNRINKSRCIFIHSPESGKDSDA